MTSVTKFTVSYISIPISALIPICPCSFEPQPYSLPLFIRATEKDSQLLIFLTSNFSSSRRYSKCLFKAGVSQFQLFPSPKAAYYPFPQLYTSFFSLKTIQKLRPAAILLILWPSSALTLVGLEIILGISLPWPVGPTGLTNNLRKRLTSLRPYPKVQTSPFSDSTMVCFYPATASMTLMLCFWKQSMILGSLRFLVSPWPSFPSDPLPKEYKFLSKAAQYPDSPMATMCSGPTEALVTNSGSLRDLGRSFPYQIKSRPALKSFEATLIINRIINLITPLNSQIHHFSILTERTQLEKGKRIRLL